MSLQFRNISKQFDDQLVVKKLDLEIASGELFVLLGTSGSGKSTVLRLVAGLSTPNSGTIQHNNIDITGLPPQKREIGFVFQNYALFQHLTVFGNIAFPLRIRSVNRPQLSQRVEELLALVGLTGLDNRMPHELSGGQRQRVALARALACNPKLLLLDEPFGALDQTIRSNLRRSFLEIQRQLKITTVLVTHDQEEAFELGDRIGVLEQGMLMEVGTPEALYLHPRTEHVARFIGNGNVLVGRLEQGKVHLGRTRVELPKESPKHEEGAPVRVVFRPEDVVVVPQQEPLNGAVIEIGEGTVAEANFNGPLRRYRLDIAALESGRLTIPHLPYGRAATSIYAAQLSSSGTRFELGQLVKVGACTFHVLRPSSLRILAALSYTNPSPSVAELATYLWSASHGALSFVSVMEDLDDSSRLKLLLEKTATSSQVRLDLDTQLHIRQGKLSTQLVREAQEANADLVIAAKFDGWIPEAVTRMIKRVGMPTLLVGDSWKKLKKILICTRGGEPGKSDVRIGARIARHTDSDVTILHVTGRNPSSEQMRILENHIEQAKRTLRALQLNHDVLIKEGRPLEVICEIANSGIYDLVVFGVTHRGRDSSATVKIIPTEFNNISVPILIVPMRGTAVD